jgi:hypothetical protein
MKLLNSKRNQENGKRLWLMSIVISILLVFVFSTVSYRDAVQVASNRSYAPTINPSGQEHKVSWKDTWNFLSGTTLERIRCKIQDSQECQFLKPFRVPKQINTNFYNLISSEFQLNVPEKSVAAIDHMQDGTILVLSKSGMVTFFNPKSQKVRQKLNLNVKYLGYNPGRIKGPLSGVDESEGLGLRDFQIYSTESKTFLSYSFLSLSSKGCLAMNLHKVELRLDSNGKWEFNQDQKIWSTNFECIKFKDAHLLGSGGKIAMYTRDKVALTLGDMNLIDRRNTSSVWGNTVLIDESSGEYEVFTIGHRNPSGIIKLSSGVLIETEQGPRGGDEINLLAKGKDYGWPFSSYGRNYSYGGYDAVENSHEFGTRPLIAFVPSPAFSSISTFSADAPEYWANERSQPDIFVSSLKAASIYRCRLSIDFSQIPYCEKIFVGERIRDLTSLKLGRESYIFLLTERSSIVGLKITNPE